MTLSDWLHKQMDRDDPVGELARRLWAAAGGPIWSNNPDNYRAYLAAQDDADMVIAVLEEALEEWRAGEKQGRE
jgi:hypothetical protein